MSRIIQLGTPAKVVSALLALALGMVFAWALLPQPAENPPEPTAESSADVPPADQQYSREAMSPDGEIPEAIARTVEDPGTTAIDDGPSRQAAGPSVPEPSTTEPTVDTSVDVEPESDTTTPDVPTTTPATSPPAVSSAPTTAAPAPTAAPSTAAATAAPPTTATARPAPTTTAPPAARGGAARPLDAARFTDFPIRNTNLDGRTQFVNTPASQLNWQQFTEGSDRTVQLGSTTPNKHLGQFRTQCSFSHFAYDDPIVFPGQEGAAHLHMFFGNTQANADSTYRSLRDSGSSSCNGFEGNRSAYWVPAIFDATGDVRIPSRIEVYYKSHDRAFSIVQKPPEGLGMVAAQARDNPNIEWGCQETGAQGTNLNRPVQQRQNTIPRCSGTATLLAHIMFPQCLRGNVRQNGPANNTNQMTYPTRGYFTNSCPEGTTYITAIEYFLAWNPDNHDGRTDEWFLASDVSPDGSRAPNGSTLHGDWFGGWNPDLMDRIHETCVSQLAECGWDLTGNNQRLQWIEHFGGRNGAAYNGRREIPAAEISEALCAGDPYGRVEDAAFCGGNGTTRTTSSFPSLPGSGSLSVPTTGAGSDDAFYCSLV